MDLRFDDLSVAKITPHLGDDKRLILTFEDGVGEYSQHAMIHMQVQFTLGIISDAMSTEGYDQVITSNLGDILVKGYSMDSLDEHLSVRFMDNLDEFRLSGNVGIIDSNMGFIDFTEADGIKKNPAR